MEPRTTMRQFGLSRTRRRRSVAGTARPSGETAAMSKAASAPASIASLAKAGRTATSVPRARTGTVKRVRVSRPPGSLTETVTSPLTGRVVSGAWGRARVSVVRPWSSVSGTSKVSRSGANCSCARPKRQPRQASKGSGSVSRRISAWPERPAPGAP